MNCECELKERPLADAGEPGDNGKGCGILAATAGRPAAGSDGAAAGPVPPGFLWLTVQWGSVGLLVHHAEIGEAKELRGAHGTARGTSIRYRSVKGRIVVTEPLVEVAARLTAAILAGRGVRGQGDAGTVDC